MFQYLRLALPHSYCFCGAGAQAVQAFTAKLTVYKQGIARRPGEILEFQVDGGFNARSPPYSRLNLEKIAVLPDIRKTHARAEAQFPCSGRRRRVANGHGLINIDYAGTLILYLDIDLSVIKRDPHTPFASMNNHIHLGLVCNNHHTAHVLRFNTQLLQPLFKAARCRACPLEVTSCYPVCFGDHDSDPAFPPPFPYRHWYRCPQVSNIPTVETMIAVPCSAA
ncbi:hypothetical protein ES703_56295 [subsurface metagenome]